MTSTINLWLDRGRLGRRGKKGRSNGTAASFSQPFAVRAMIREEEGQEGKHREHDNQLVTAGHTKMRDYQE